MWEDVLKVQVLGSKQKVKMGIKPLPKEDEGPCWTKLEAALKYLESQANHFQEAIIKWEQVPEEVACKIIEMYKVRHGSGDFHRLNDLFIYVDYYIDNDITLDLQVYPPTTTEEEHQKKGEGWDRHLIHIRFKTNWEEYHVRGYEYNQKIYNIIKKFLNMLGQKPYNENTIFNEAWFKKLYDRGGL